VLQSTSISGAITRVTSGTGIAGATVQALQAGVIIGSATTAANGTYSIPGFYPGTYDVRVFATGFSSELRQAIPATLPTTTVNVALYAPGTVSGRVTQADGLTPIAGAAVAVYSGPIQKGTANTNAAGDYSIFALHPGSYTAQAASVGYTTSEQSVVVNEAATTTKNFSLNGAPSAPVQYAYDALGRLIEVTDPSGGSAIYRYDAVGNITAIERPGTNGSSSVAISGFSSASGAVGSTVTIFGTGFTASAGQTCVTFNGTAATVTSATATQIVTAVPAGATTGPVAVGAPCGSASAPTAFVVTAAAAPTITGFTPTLAAPGAAVTVNGTNFDTVPSKNNLNVNISPALVNSATTTALQATVPLLSGTGRVAVATVNGTAQSTAYLWVAPPPYAVTDIDSTGLLSVGDNSVAVTTVNKVALRAFNGLEGHRAAINVTGVSTGSGYVYLYDPFGTLLNYVLAGPGGFVDTVDLRSTATYSVVFASASAATPTGTLTLYDVPVDFASAIAFETALSVPDGSAGQNAKLTFTGTAGQRLSLEQTSALNCFTATTAILDPNGASIASTCGGTFIDATNPITATGTYTVLVNPKDANHAPTTLTLHSVPADAGGSTTIGGNGVVVPMNVPGQNGLVTFSGTAQQVVTVHVTANNVGRGTLTLNTEAGQQVGQTAWLGGGDFTLANQTLPSTGNYQIVVDPYDVNTGSLTVSVTSP
jgi:YD repeat-containing protein